MKSVPMKSATTAPRPESMEEAPVAAPEISMLGALTVTAGRFSVPTDLV